MPAAQAAPTTEVTVPTAQVRAPTTPLPAQAPARPAQAPIDDADGRLPRRSNVGLRLAVWLCAFLVLAGLAVLAVRHWHPGWLGHSASIANAGPAIVKVASSTGSTERIAVGAATFTVIVTDLQPAWIEVRSPTSKAAAFSGVLRAGETKSIRSAGGQLLVVFGGSQATVKLAVNGATVPGWSFRPSHVPFTLEFSSRSTS